MKFDLENLNPGVQFDSADRTSSITLRACNGAALDEINRETAKKVPGKIRRGVFVAMPDIINEERRNELLWDYMIIDWDIKDANGDPILCTTDNKFKLMRNSVLFAVWVGECIEQLTESSKTYETALEKNSVTSQSG